MTPVGAFSSGIRNVNCAASASRRLVSPLLREVWAQTAQLVTMNNSKMLDIPFFMPRSSSKPNYVYLDPDKIQEAI
jgi:hypothetical protein